MAIAYGVIADVCPPAERGAMLGFAIGGSNLATCLGPVVGGWIALGSGGSEWVFWALVIFGAGVFLLVGMALPETARNVVGNGSVKTKGWRQTWWNVLKGRRKGVKDVEDECGSGSGERAMGTKERFKLANPWACIRVLFWRDTALVLWLASSPYAVWYCVQTSIPLIYKDTFGFNELQVGLAYITGATGVMIGGYLNGKLMDRNYRVTAREIGCTINKVSGDDLDHFPIERARARGSYYLLSVYICALAGYGWAVESRVHESVPLILQFVIGALCTSFQQTFNALLVDVFPASPSTAAAASNIVRCTLSAVAVAVLQPIVEAVGRGWFFTILTGLSGSGGFVAAWAIDKKGMEWRRARVGKMKKVVEGEAIGEKRPGGPSG